VASAKSRRLARERALQCLYGIDFTGYGWREALEQFWDENNVRPTVRQYAERLIQGVCDARDELDTQIVEALDHWTPDRVGRIEWGILRIALFEMRYMQDVPNAVAINEAIEVAKRFAGDEAPRFINGVLDRLRKRIESEARADSAP
jgi:N utilization substance protein B